MAENNTELVALVRELSATGKDPITAVGVQAKVSLRQAIANIYWKSTSVLKLTDRPRDPRLADDQYGHILSLRAEVQVLRNLVAALARAQGLDVEKLTTEALEAIQ